MDISVLRCEATPDPAGIDLPGFACFSAALGGADGCEHLLFGDGLRRLRLDVAGTVLAGPVRLSFALEMPGLAEAGLLSLRQLLRVIRTGTMPRGLFAPEPRAARWILALRAGDARACGASQRDIAVMLFGAGRVAAEWNAASDHLKSRVRRLLALDDRMRSGGWRSVLAGERP